MRKQRIVCGLTCVVLVGVLGCSVGKTPPKATDIAYVEGYGNFRMGSDDHAPCGRFQFDNGALSLAADDAIASERIRYEAQIEPFCMDRHEVTIEQYEHCVLRGTCSAPKVTNLGKLNRGDAIASYWSRTQGYLEYPVVGVEWQNAQEYCEFRGGRLPTEIEWEYAASRTERLSLDVRLSIEAECAQSQGELAVGNCSDSILSVADNRGDETQDGIWGLHSAVSEWTSDEYDIFSGCAPTQAANEVMLEDLLCANASDGRVYRRPLDTLLDDSAMGCADALLVPEDAEERSCDEDLSYGGRCVTDFKGCYTVCGQSALSTDESSACLSTCFSDYEACVQPCLAEGVQIACARLSDGQNCYPEPVCIERNIRNSTVAHIVPRFLRTDKNAHVVKGAHFQVDRACEVRSSKRRGDHAASALVGFRCVFDISHARCAAEMGQ